MRPKTKRLPRAIAGIGIFQRFGNMFALVDAFFRIELSS